MKKIYVVFSYLMIIYTISCNQAHQPCKSNVFSQADFSEFRIFRDSLIQSDKYCAVKCNLLEEEGYMIISGYLFNENGKIFYLKKHNNPPVKYTSELLFDYSIPQGSSYSTTIPIYLFDINRKIYYLAEYINQTVFLSDKIYDSNIKDTAYRFLFKDFNRYTGQEDLLVYFTQSKGITGIAYLIDGDSENKIILMGRGNLYRDSLYSKKKFNLL